MRVYLIVHDDRVYDMGDCYVRGAYTSEQAAEAAIPRKDYDKTTPTWARVDHNAHCCAVEELEVEE